MALRIGDYQLILRVIESFAAARTPGELHRATREGLAAAVPGDCYDLVLVAGAQAEDDLFISNPGTYTEAEMRYMLDNAAKHPLVAPFLAGDPGAICVSEVVPCRQWWGSEFYRESGYQRLGLRHELSALLPSGGRSSLAAVSVVRSRKFSARDRAILDGVRPHLGRAWRQVLAARQAPSPARVRRAFPALSGREAEVLFWITEGKQNREIAGILERRLTTVQEHVENIIRKLGRENRHETAVFALRALLEG